MDAYLDTIKIKRSRSQTIYLSDFSATIMPIKEAIKLGKYTRMSLRHLLHGLLSSII